MLQAILPSDRYVDVVSGDYHKRFPINPEDKKATEVRREQDEVSSMVKDQVASVDKD